MKKIILKVNPAIMSENLGHCIEKRRKTPITEKYVKFKDNRKFEAYFVQMTEMSQ